MSKVIPFPRKKQKHKARRKREVLRDLIFECSETGPPDYELINKILDKFIYGKRPSDMDVFAMYLYRKRCEGD